MRENIDIFTNLCLDPTSSGARFQKGKSKEGKIVGYWPRQSDWFDLAKYKKPRLGTIEDQPLPPDKGNDYTFDSCVFDELMRVYQANYMGDFFGFRYDLMEFGKNFGLSSRTVNAIGAQKNAEYLIKFIVLQAKNAENEPLEYEPCGSWQIVNVDELPFPLENLADQIRANDIDLYSIPKALQFSRSRLTTLFQKYGKFFWFILDGSEKIQGNFSFIPLTDEQEKLMRMGELADSTIDVESAVDLQSPWDGALYLLNLSVNPGVRLDYYYALWDHFMNELREYAKRGIFFTKIYYKSFLPDLATRVLGRGFQYLTSDAIFGDVYVLDLTDESTLFFLSEELKPLYEKHWAECRRTVKLAERMNGSKAFSLLFRKIDDLFLDFRFYQLKPYFFEEGAGTPDDPDLFPIGVVVAEILRDVLQYSEALLPFVSPSLRRSYQQVAEQILKSELVRASREGYCFTTEKLPPAQTRYTVSPGSIFQFAQVWIDLDMLFLDPEVLVVRPYFYEKRGLYPTEELEHRALGVAMRLLSAMHFAERLLEGIPDDLVRSYFDYKKTMVTECMVVREALRQFPFIAKELNISHLLKK